jgi:hypothetical protein
MKLLQVLLSDNAQPWLVVVTLLTSVACLTMLAAVAMRFGETFH